MLLKWDSISWRKILVILHNFVQWLVVNTLFQEMMDHHNQEDGSRETQKLDLYWKSRPVICTVNMELKSESGLWVKTIFILGSEFLMDQINMWLIQITTTQKFLQIYLKNKRHNRVWELLQPDQRQKQNHKREKLLNHRALFQWMKESGLILNQQNPLSLSAYEVSKKVIHLLRHCLTIQREDDGAVQFWESSFIFGINFHKTNIGRMIVGKYAWQQEDQKEDISTDLIFQEQLFTSELFKDTQDVVSLILCYKTMW